MARDAPPRLGCMKQTSIKTIRLPLRHSSKKKQLLLAVMKETRDITREVSHRMPSIPVKRWKKSTDNVYYGWVKDLRENIYAQCAQEAVEKVREAWASWASNGFGKNKPVFGENGKMWARWHNQSYKIFSDDEGYYLQVPTIKNGRGFIRIVLPFVPSDYSFYFLEKIVEGTLDNGAMEIHHHDDRFVAHITIKQEVDVSNKMDTAIGVDLGLRNIAVMAAVDALNKDIVDGSVKVWSGRQASHIRDRYCKLRKQYGKKGLLGKIQDSKGRENRWIENVNHNISRELVTRAEEYDNPVIVMEELKYIRERVKNKHMNRALHSWAFRDIQNMIEYKALEIGIPTQYINPRNTSKKCNRCGHVSRKNRAYGAPLFKCQNCGYEVNADVNAAVNIGRSIL